MINHKCMYKIKPGVPMRGLTGFYSTKLFPICAHCCINLLYNLALTLVQIVMISGQLDSLRYLFDVAKLP